MAPAEPALDRRARGDAIEAAALGFLQREAADGPVAKMIEADRARLDSPGRTKLQTIRVTQQDADRITAGRVRRIAVKSEQRGAKLPPPPASASDIQTALNAFAGKRDMNSTAITRALQTLLAAHQKAAPA